MKKKYFGSLTGVVILKYFTLLPEYFLSVSIFYTIITVLLLGYSVYGLVLAKALSDCSALTIFMTFCLIINDDLLSNSDINFYNAIFTDFLSYISKILICLFSTMYILLMSHSIKEQKLAFFEYLVIILFSILGLLIMCSSNDLLIAYISIELSSLALYTLAAFKKTSIYSVDSGLKYFITGSISSSFFLLGSSFLYAFSGTISFEDFYALYSSLPIHVSIRIPDYYDYIMGLEWDVENANSPEMIMKIIFDIGLEHYPVFCEMDLVPVDYYNYIHLPPFDFSIIELGQTFILFSLFIKLAAAPFHLWSLDVYEGSPTSSSFFFATVTKLSTFVLLIRITFCNMNYHSEGWQFYFFAVGAISVFVGSFGGLRQRKLKTLLAYSSTTNMGYALLALGVNHPVGIQMLYFHLIMYIVSGLCTWSIVTFLRLRLKKKKIFFYGYNKVLGDLSLLFKSNPALSFGLAASIFSFSGVPPMVGFLSKMGIFMSLITVTYYVVAIPVIIFSIAATFYYIRLIKVIYFENILIGRLYFPINFSSTLILSSLTFFLILSFIFPNLIYIWSYQVVGVLYHQI